jgi:hypothetical protein
MKRQKYRLHKVKLAALGQKIVLPLRRYDFKGRVPASLSKEEKRRKLAFPFMSSRALLASSSVANFTKPNPFDRLVILSVTMVAELG